MVDQTEYRKEVSKITNQILALSKELNSIEFIDLKDKLDKLSRDWDKFKENNFNLVKKQSK